MEQPKPKRPTWTAWLGFRFENDPRQIPWLGPIVGFFIACSVFLVVIAAIAAFVHFIAALFHVGSYNESIEGEAIRNLGLVVAAIFGAPFLVWRSIVLAKQTDIAEASLLNEKISSAAEGLRTRREPSLLVNSSDDEVFKWEDDVVARIVAIDQLLGVAQEDPSTSPRITELLTAYIRANFACEDTTPTPGLEKRKNPRMDLQKAVNAISQLLPTARKYDPTNWRLDLKSCNFDGVDFSDKNFFAADFSSSRFEACNFDRADFRGTLFYNALLDYASFNETNLTGAKLDYSTLQNEMGGWNIGLAGADLTGTSFRGADLSGVDYLGKPEELSKTFGSKDTKLHFNIQYQLDHLPSISGTLRSQFIRNPEKLTVKQIESLQPLCALGFQNWSPFKAEDGSNGWLRKKLYEKLELTDWPYLQ